MEFAERDPPAAVVLGVTGKEVLFAQLGQPPQGDAAPGDAVTFICAGPCCGTGSPSGSGAAPCTTCCCPSFVPAFSNGNCDA